MIMQYVEFLVFLILWMAVCAALVAGVEMMLKALGFRIAPVPHHQSAEVPMEADD